MDPLNSNSSLPCNLATDDRQCTPDLTDMLTVANISHGMDPLQAALDAQLQAPLIEPFLF